MDSLQLEESRHPRLAVFSSSGCAHTRACLVASLPCCTIAWLCYTQQVTSTAAVTVVLAVKHSTVHIVGSAGSAGADGSMEDPHCTIGTRKAGLCARSTQLHLPVSMYEPGGHSMAHVAMPLLEHLLCCVAHRSPPNAASPAGPVGPMAPVLPSSPARPSVPVGPVGPAKPWLPFGPVGPAVPREPGMPGAPRGPVGPRGPFGPVGPLAQVLPQTAAGTLFAVARPAACTTTKEHNTMKNLLHPRLGIPHETVIAAIVLSVGCGGSCCVLWRA